MRILHIDDLTIQPRSAQRVGGFAVCLASRPTTLTLALRRGEAVIASNSYDLLVYLPPRQPATAWLMRRAADLMLQIG